MIIINIIFLYFKHIAHTHNAYIFVMYAWTTYRIIVCAFECAYMCLYAYTPVCLRACECLFVFVV